MKNFLILVTIFAFLATVNAQQWTSQQLEVYRQQYYNWWYNQQRMQQVPQQPAPQQTRSSFFGNAQSDDKGNMWHGDDNAKLMVFARSSWP